MGDYPDDLQFGLSDEEHDGVYTVYRIFNIITGKSYIGATSNFKARKRQHLDMLRKGCHHSLKLQYAWDNSNESSFIWSILKIIPLKEMVHELETDFIQKYNAFENGYNMTEGSSYLKPCSWNGTHFQSIAEASEYLGINRATMSMRVLNGYLNDDDLKRGIKIVFDGIEYQNARQASEAMGVSHTTILYNIKRGRKLTLNNSRKEKVRRKNIIAGMKKASMTGINIGRPAKDDDKILLDYPEVSALLREGYGIRATSRMSSVARNTVRKVKLALENKLEEIKIC